MLGEALATQVGGLPLTVLCNRLSWPCALQPGADNPHALAACGIYARRLTFAPWGGVVPTLAMEAHAAAMDGTVAEALRKAGVQPADLDAVAVSIGPGAEHVPAGGCLPSASPALSCALPVQEKSRCSA